MSFNNVNEVGVISSLFPKYGEVMVVSQMASFDLSLIEVIMMSDLVTPQLFNVWMLKAFCNFLFCMMSHAFKMFQFKWSDFNNYVSHCAYLINKYRGMLML